METVDQECFQCVVLDWGATLSSDYYFQIAPEGCPEWSDVVEKLLIEGRKLDPWMDGRVSWRDFAGMVVARVGLDGEIVEDYLRKGVRGLSMNKVVTDFALAQREAGQAIVLVTCNIDLFTEIVVPDFELDRMFDAIVNSADYRETRKEVLWPIAVNLLDVAITYSQCLLVEDSQKNVELFRELGGRACQYTDDACLSKWLTDAGLVEEGNAA